MAVGKFPDGENDSPQLPRPLTDKYGRDITNGLSLKKQSILVSQVANKQLFATCCSQPTFNIDSIKEDEETSFDQMAAAGRRDLNTRYEDVMGSVLGEVFDREL
jgi:hypothetical protein